MRGRRREHAGVLRLLPFAAALLAVGCGSKSQGVPDVAADRPAVDLGSGNDVEPLDAPAPDGGSDDAAPDATDAAAGDAAILDAAPDSPPDAPDDGRRDATGD